MQDVNENIFEISAVLVCVCAYFAQISNFDFLALSFQDRREREQQEMESAKEIAEEDFDGFP